jgi:hypothetical protein
MITALAAFVSLMLPAEPRGSADGEQASLAARPQAPIALLGTWYLDVDRSKYVSVPTPTSGVRIFEDDGPGRVLCTYSIVNADGTRTTGHWSVALDGQEYSPAYVRTTSAKTTARENLAGYTMVLKLLDEFTIVMRLKQNSNGSVTEPGRLALSRDGAILTHSVARTVQGRQASDLAIYRKHD